MYKYLYALVSTGLCISLLVIVDLNMVSFGQHRYALICNSMYCIHQIMFVSNCLYLSVFACVSDSLCLSAYCSQRVCGDDQEAPDHRQLLARAQRADLHCLAQHINYYLTLLRMS